MRSPIVAALVATWIAAPLAAHAHEDREAPPAPGATPQQPAAPQPQGTAPAPEVPPPAAGSAQPGAAQGGSAPAPSDAERKKLEADIAKELGATPGGTAPSTGQGGQAPAQAQGAPQGGATPPGGGSAYARLLLLPDISAIGSVALSYDSYKASTLSPRAGPVSPPNKPMPSFEELELGLQAVVDPYARADAFVSIDRSGAAVEEAYLTTLTLPAGLQVRAGQFFSPFGRINQQHPHVWEFIDEPLARGRVLAEDVLSGPGVDVAWLTPLPWFAELHLDGQATAPYPGDVDRLTGVARLLQYADLGVATTLGIGLSGGIREEGSGAYRQLGGVDVYLRYRPIDSRSWTTLQAELYARKFTGMAGGSDLSGYVQLYRREGPYFGYGVRYDNAPSAGDSPPGPEQRVSALGAWYASEFQRIRLQVSWDRRPGGRDGLEALAGLEFAIGAHGAHPF